MRWGHAQSHSGDPLWGQGLGNRIVSLEIQHLGELRVVAVLILSESQF